MSIEENMPKTESQQHEAPYIGEAMRDLEDRFAPKIEEAKQQLDQVNTRLKTYIRANPGTSLLIAVGAGYLIGRMASRR